MGEHGLVGPLFVLPRPTREQRDLTRYRKSVIEERGRETQRLHKVLEDTGVSMAYQKRLVAGLEAMGNRVTLEPAA